jgi:hypothetical protein
VRNLNARGLSDIPGLDDFSGERQRVEDALYARATSRLDPQMQQQQRQLESRLAAQGITAGSAAHRQALDDFARRSADAYAGARNDAILAGGGEQSRIFADALAGRGQMFGEREAMTAADMAYRGQRLGEQTAASAADLARRNQLFGERQAGSQQALANRAQMFGERESAGSFANLAQQQDYNQQVADRARSIEEILALRNQPINEIAALMGTGGGVTQPEFRGSGEAANAAAQQYQAQLAGWQQQQQGRQSTLGGLFGLGGQLGAAGILAGRGGGKY